MGTDTEGVKFLSGDEVKIRMLAMLMLVPPEITLENHEAFLLGLVKGNSVEVGLKGSKF